MADWYVGQEVVCVNTRGFSPRHKPWPELNKVYHIYAIDICPWDSSQVGFMLTELPLLSYEPNRARFLSKCFKPVEKPKTEQGFSILKKLLVAKSIKELVE